MKEVGCTEISHIARHPLFKQHTHLMSCKMDRANYMEIKDLDFDSTHARVMILSTGSLNADPAAPGLSQSEI